MKDWFDSLETRERLFVGVGAVVVAIAVLYGFLWSPLDRNHDQMLANVDLWQKSVARIRPLKGLAQSGAQPSGPVVNASTQAPIIIVDQTLHSRGLEQYRRRSQPTSSNGIRVEFENVAFDDLVLWLGDLSDQYAMHVQAGSVSMPAQASPGRINASLTLERTR